MYLSEGVTSRVFEKARPFCRVSAIGFSNVDHPADAEFVFDPTERVAPGFCLQTLLNFAALAELLKDFAQPFVIGIHRARWQNCRLSSPDTPPCRPHP